MKIGINGEEAFPVYQVFPPDSNKNHAQLEVDKTTLGRWKKGFDDFHALQEEIKAEMVKQGKEDQIWYKQNFYGFEV